MDEAGPDLTGAVLDGRYRVIEVIAEGAMGVVYRAERIKLGRIVAIKVMHESLPSELSSRQRFEIEAMAMAKLEHPHCAAVLDVGVHGDRPYVVMDFVSGDNLKDVLEKRKLPIIRVVEIMRQVLSGLAHAHELGIIHRDIKPANIVLSQKAGLGDHVKVLDFGLARLNIGGRAKTEPALTVGMVVGTPSYMAPEQCTGGTVDARTDLYACGVMLFELLSNKKPFVSAADDPVEVVRMHLQQPPPTLADATGQEFGPELESIVARALAKEPDDRYASATEFAADLEVIRARLLSAPIALPSRPTPQPFAAATGLPAPPTPALAPTHPIAWIPLERRQLQIAAGVLGGLVLLVIVAVAKSGGPAAVSRDAGVAAVVAPEPIEMPAVPRDPAIELIERAQQLIDANKRDAALELVDNGRGVFPTNATLAYMAGKLYFGKLYWTAGLKAFHEAIAADPTYRGDPELIKYVLRGFITTPSYNAELATFLRVEIGAAAQPFLQEAADSHPNAAIRARAAAELKRYR